MYNTEKDSSFVCVCNIYIYITEKSGRNLLRGG